ncbi:hypothetical protein DFQ27_008070 [Actinomortierella ambigua]|uniref:Protein kinase domain-containing protein n=1 Tax=Actinomortierella ambigua TaxID=1343610 RepID=A0A9P6TZA8_9FUNG|nr:hypothetical protein DFQ27_008070 [Actinomortierella ambigua]
MSTLIVDSFIGGGAYGQVHCAQWEGRKVAVKKFLMAQDEVRQAAIQHEINILQCLADRHIIQFYGTTYHEGQLVLIMDYAEGGSLHRAIEARLIADWPMKTRIAQEVVRGLAYIHQKDILHRDLKSMNVLLTRHMEVKLCDFGLATVKVRSASKSTSSAKGTTRWMAPELFTARPKYSTKSDMFALGVVMWELAADCTVPFREQIDNYTVIGLVKNGEREELPGETPLDYRRWVKRCWDQDPAKRPEASEMVTKYDKLDYGVGLSDRECGSDLSLTMTGMTIASSGGEGAKRPNSDTGQSYEEISVLLTKANAGDTTAQVALAVYYEKGIGVEKSKMEAFKWYLRAAASGSTKAQFKTGSCFKYGCGTVRNHAVAAYWLQQAAEGGCPLAQSELGWMYQNGLGVELDHNQALLWYHKSAEQGDLCAQNSLGLMYQKRSGS